MMEKNGNSGSNGQSGTQNFEGLSVCSAIGVELSRGDVQDT